MFSRVLSRSWPALFEGATAVTRDENLVFVLACAEFQGGTFLVITRQPSPLSPQRPLPSRSAHLNAEVKVS